MIEGRAAFVTGGTGSIGTAICRGLCAAGIRVAAGCRVNSSRKQQWVSSMEALGYQAFAVELDVCEWGSAKAALQRVRSELGPIDILINNAGIVCDRSFRKMGHQEWEDVINTNLNSLFHVTQHVLEDMLERGWGRIINISSVNGQTGQVGQTNYAAAKAGMHGFTMALAREVAHRNVTVNTVSPGYIESEMVAGLRPEVRDRILDSIPVRRFGRPEEIASMVGWLVSDEAGFATGADFCVNGGMHMC